MKIPFTGLKRQYKQLRDELLDVTDSVLSSGQLMNGKYTRNFEDWLARTNHSEYAITCHSGTQALEIIAEYSIEYTGVPHPPTVLIPTLTYAATANAFIRAGWDVVFIDTDNYGLFNINAVPDTSYQAILLVGLYGSSLSNFNGVKWWNYWTRSDKLIIEDGAQHWLANNSMRVGEATAISFDPTKNLSAYGNGGAIITDSQDLASFARKWRGNGKPDGDVAGTNSRMSELECALMLLKTQYLHEWQQRRAAISRHYIERFKDSPVRCLIDDTNIDEHAHHKFVIEVDRRDQLQDTLLELGIETKIHYEQPLHEIGIYRQYTGPSMLSAASSLSRRCLSLPIYPELTDSEVDVIADRVLNFFS